MFGISQGSFIHARRLLPGGRKLSQQVRSLSIYEYQGQDLLQRARVPVPRGRLAESAEDVQRAVAYLGGPCVVKAQILAGGRGKGVFNSGLNSGVHLVQTPEEAFTISSQMIGHRLSTKQTPNDGFRVDKIYVAEQVKYDEEFYISIAIDRNNSCPAIIASRYGGMNIEAAAQRDKDSVIRMPIEYQEGIDLAMSQQVAVALGLQENSQKEKLHQLLTNLYNLFKSSDATLLEINPLVLTSAGQLLCLDSKFNFDSAARFRQPDVFALEDKPHTSRDKLEEEAANLGFAYVRLEGNIGNIVNGAGLAMATNDSVNYFGGNCANFLDAGGKATKETMADAFRIVLSDDRVRVVFINIYGGIIAGDMVARSIIEGVQEIGPLRVPMVVRLQGTNSAEGQKLLAECGLSIHSVNDFTEAVQLAVDLAAENKQ